jgi:hypothetical protein
VPRTCATLTVTLSGLLMASVLVVACGRSTAGGSRQHGPIGVSVDSVKLVSIDATQRAQCQKAANAIHTPVSCPSLIPDPIRSAEGLKDCNARVSYDEPPTCSRPSIEGTGSELLVNQYSFQLPHGYVGVPMATAVNGDPLGHFVIVAGRNLNTNRGGFGIPRAIPSYCAAVSPSPTIVVHGTAAMMYECGENPGDISYETDLGHELLVWTQSSITCEVSLHGHSQVNRDLDIAIANATRMVLPTTTR